jgi:hypothetical protein
LADPRLQAGFGDHIDGMTKEVLEFHEQRGQVEQTSPRLEVDQKVDVTGGVGLPTRNGPEDTDIAGAMASSGGEDPLANAGKLIDRWSIGHVALLSSAPQ